MRCLQCGKSTPNNFCSDECRHLYTPYTHGEGRDREVVKRLENLSYNERKGETGSLPSYEITACLRKLRYDRR